MGPRVVFDFECLFKWGDKNLEKPVENHKRKNKLNLLNDPFSPYQ